jgi:glycosyltransferase involved in cell wall biosynthesis
VVGDAGLLVDPSDEEAIELAVRRVLEEGELAEELRRRGLERARRFTWEACARLTVDVYRAARDH